MINKSTKENIEIKYVISHNSEFISRGCSTLSYFTNNLAKARMFDSYDNALEFLLSGMYLYGYDKIEYKSNFTIKKFRIVNTPSFEEISIEY